MARATSFRASAALALIAAAALAGACQTAPAPSPAVLVSADAQTMARLTSALAQALGRATIELGAGDPTQTSSLSVLPPPLGSYETRSVATPIHFDILLRGESCFLKRRDTGEEIALDGVACRPVEF